MTYLNPKQEKKFLKKLCRRLDLAIRRDAALGLELERVIGHEIIPINPSLKEDPRIGEGRMTLEGVIEERKEQFDKELDEELKKLRKSGYTPPRVSMTIQEVYRDFCRTVRY